MLVGPSNLTLPAPSVDARSHSERLAASMRAEMDANAGRITFQRFMQMALYAPGLGYYTSATDKFGPEGDFVTAPEISALFSRCVARQIEEIAGQLGTRTVLEIGAGRGVMAAQILLACAENNVAIDRYLILETSADLRARQHQLLAASGLDQRVEISWLSDYPATGFEGVVVANEVLDAMPVARFVAGAPISEQFVSYQRGRFTLLQDEPETPGLNEAVSAIERDLGSTLAPGYVSEVGLLRSGWTKELCERIQRGVVLLFDYGYSRREYFHPQRSDGTLTCYYRHRRHDDVFHLPGLQDLTAHVDFSAIAEAAEVSGAAVAGFTTQANFLLSCGVVEMLEGMDPQSQSYLALAGELKQLMLPGEMGDIFKVMALAKNVDTSLLGFAARDFRATL